MPNPNWKKCEVKRKDGSLCGSSIPIDDEGNPLPSCAGHLRLEALGKVEAQLSKRVRVEIDEALLERAADLSSLETDELVALQLRLQQREGAREISVAVVTGLGIAGHAS